MYLFVFIFMVMCYFTQTCEDEDKQLNFEEHKEEFEMQSLTVMDLSRAETQMFQDHICWQDFSLRKYQSGQLNEDEHKQNKTHHV